MSIFGLQPYQFIITALALIMLVSALERFLRGGKGQTFLKLIVRLFIWGGLIAISLFPGFTSALAGRLGLEGNSDGVMLIGFLFVFLMMFKLLSIIERIEQQITQLTRDHALHQFEREQKGDANL